MKDEKKNTPEEAGCGHEAALLLPWYVSGTLEGDELARVKAHLQSCAQCAADERRERRLHGLLDGAAAVEPMPQPGLQTLLARVDAAQPAGRTGAGRIERTTRRPRPALTRWLVAAVLVQAIGLGVLGALLADRSARWREPSFSTLSAPAPAAGTRLVRTMFAPSLSLGELQRLLASLPATVVSGPSQTGIYTLALATTEEAPTEAALARLRAHEHVLFAELQFSPESVP